MLRPSRPSTSSSSMAVWTILSLVSVSRGIAAGYCQLEQGSNRTLHRSLLSPAVGYGRPRRPVTAVVPVSPIGAQRQGCRADDVRRGKEPGRVLRVGAQHGEAVQQCVQRDPALQLGQGRADTVMDAMAETEVRVRAPRRVEDLRVRE